MMDIAGCSHGRPPHLHDNGRAGSTKSTPPVPRLVHGETVMVAIEGCSSMDLRFRERLRLLLLSIFLMVVVVPGAGDCRPAGLHGRPFLQKRPFLSSLDLCLA